MQWHGVMTLEAEALEVGDRSPAAYPPTWPLAVKHFK